MDHLICIMQQVGVKTLIWFLRKSEIALDRCTWSAPAVAIKQQYLCALCGRANSPPTPRVRSITAVRLTGHTVNTARVVRPGQGTQASHILVTPAGTARWHVAPAPFDTWLRLIIVIYCRKKRGHLGRRLCPTWGSGHFPRTYSPGISRVRAIPPPCLHGVRHPLRHHHPPIYSIKRSTVNVYKIDSGRSVRVRGTG